MRKRQHNGTASIKRPSRDVQLTNWFLVEFNVLRCDYVQHMVFWVVMPNSSQTTRRFEELYCLHIQDKRLNQARHQSGRYMALQPHSIYFLYDVSPCSPLIIVVSFQGHRGDNLVVFFFLFLGVGWDWDHVVPRPLTGLLYQPRTIDNECGAVGGMRIGRGSRSTRRKPAPAPLCPPQIPHDLTRPRTRIAAVGSRQLTAELWHGPAISSHLSNLFMVHLMSASQIMTWNGKRITE
jgi:hypothetical protein